jgi:hypothetical protein
MRIQRSCEPWPPLIWCWMLDLASTHRSSADFPACPSSWSLCSPTTRLIWYCSPVPLVERWVVFLIWAVAPEWVVCWRFWTSQMCLVHYRTSCLHRLDCLHYLHIWVFLSLWVGNSGRWRVSSQHLHRELRKGSTRTISEYIAISFIGGTSHSLNFDILRAPADVSRGFCTIILYRHGSVLSQCCVPV